jgi:hypothetical protein
MIDKLASASIQVVARLGREFPCVVLERLVEVRVKARELAGGVAQVITKPADNRQSGFDWQGSDEVAIAAFLQ